MSGFYLSEENFNRIKRLSKDSDSTSKIMEFLSGIAKSQTIAENSNRELYSKLKSDHLILKESTKAPSKRSKGNAKKLRQEKLLNPTKSEKLFDEYLEECGVRHNREKPFYCGSKLYFADFYIPYKNVIIEIDGGYHNLEGQVVKDNMRTSDLVNLCGVNDVIRITNEQVEDKDFCIEFIKSKLIYK